MGTKKFLEDKDQEYEEGSSENSTNSSTFKEVTTISKSEHEANVAFMLLNDMVSEHDVDIIAIEEEWGTLSPYEEIKELM